MLMKIWTVLILFKHLQINQILALNNPWGIDMSLNKSNQTKSFQCDLSEGKFQMIWYDKSISRFLLPSRLGRP